ncbi:MATE family efflux transporter [Treponema zioleckii]|uniref:MATE family efflux transporter n=1 Tax=Treponema zioleckii TaxID=331680 RepID=UPI002413C279|nr:MATE family efflux transporter [Treponema zioleckii]
MKVILYVCAPLALYQSLTQVFKVFDTMMASHISSTAVSSVAYISQIQIMLSALGSGLAVGASIKVSEAYGAGDFELVRRRVSTMAALCAILGLGVLLALLPFSRSFLEFMNTPEEFLEIGIPYFRIELVALVVTFFNNIYIAIERARGNSKRILWMNMGIVITKLSLTAVFIYIFHWGVTSIAIATLVSQLTVLATAAVNMSKKDNLFSFSAKAVSFKKQTVMPMVNLSVPVIIEKAAFAMGKVIVNSMCTVYGSQTVGALGISNNIGGITTMPQSGFQEGGSAVISQNRGAGKYERTLLAFKCELVCNILIGAVLMAVTLLGLEYISRFFAGDDDSFNEMIKTIYRYEAWGAIPLGVNASVLSLMYGFGKTKVTLFMNFCRIFLFRVPVLVLLRAFTNYGSESAGIVMGVSNILSGVLAIILGIITFVQIKFEFLEIQ